MYNLTFDNPYNRAIQNKMLDLTKNQGWEPDRVVGGCGVGCNGGSKLRPSYTQQPSFFKVVPKSEEYIQPGVGASYPQLNMEELENFNQLDLSKEKVVPFQGGEAGGFNFKKSVLKPVGSVVRSKPVQGLLKKGAQEAVKASVLAITKNPVLAETVATATKGLTDKAVEASTEKIGRGKKQRKPRTKKVAGVEEFKGGKLELLISKSKDVKEPKEPKKQKETKKSNLSKRVKRAQLVKEIMNKNNMTLPQASKYIKENNLM